MSTLRQTFTRFVEKRAISLVCLLALSVPTLAQALTLTGQWYDRQHSGHGLDLNHVVNGQNSTLFGTFFTYAADGRPQWLWLIEPETAAPSGALSRLNRQTDGQIRTEVVGSFSLTPVQRCADGLPREGARALLEFRASLAEGNLLWCLEPVLPETSAPEAALDGHWYSEDPADFGVGMISHFYTQPGQSAAQGFHFIYFYDADGFPRWAVANGQSTGFSASWDFYTLRGSCFGCPTNQLSEAPIGRADIRLSSVNANAPQSNHIRVSLRFDERSVFNQNATLKLLSSPNRVKQAASTSEGVVSGTSSAGVERFSNIPFAAAPLGDNRFRAPQPPAVRQKVYVAQEIGPGCMQPEGQALFGARPQQQSEDCLQLNVWRPASASESSSLLPVMVWIHGGGLTIGSAVESLNGRLIYDGDAFARKDVVLVSINYRLGAFGYMAPSAMLGEATDQPSAGNYGLLDQIAALKWVKQNIAQFGGDPSKVTIFGESAGGVSVCALLSSPLARGLFIRAIAQSGNCLQNLPSLESAHQQAQRIAQRLGCTEIATQRECLRAVSAPTLLAASQAVINANGAQGESYGLSLDGFSLTQTPADALRSGSAAQIGLMLGVNDDESTSLSPAVSLPSTVSGYEALIRQQSPLVANAILARYPASSYSSPQRAYQDLIDDVRFTCANRRAAFDHAARGNRVYHYVLTDVLPDPQLAPLESFHGLDVSYLFGRPGGLPPELALRAKMQSAWVNFASDGEPGNALGYPWPRYGSARLSAELNATANAPMNDYRREYCEFWANYVVL